ncbi:intermembrane transport protein PqiB [Magnetofaba australis]|uniref:Putative paraquat-inducible protein B n=1 Tax=Magnetofaba australis IT-1 TaxID=1434232 RepID=A0A1Y2K263_9PROT|nr:MlaD family protein [Magnetofaba australis]OSM01696.1 putative paraquat-inducible protein B [Magnetofaba australis IT-1]
MTEEQTPLAQAQTRKKRGLSLVWILPLTAALVVGWLALDAWLSRGPEILITFKNAQGLVAGKTPIKYKQVQMGVVEKVTLAEDLSQVTVTARMRKQVAGHLTSGARFWVVRPQLSIKEVSGLDTLVSGVYIAMAPGKGDLTRRFTAQEKAPAIAPDQPGRSFTLTTPDLGSLQVGSPVYYRGLDVGQVVDYQLNQQRTGVNVRIYVNAPHHYRVRKNSRFWNVSGINVSVGADGMRVNTQSLQSLLAGGVAFDAPETSLDDSAPAEAERVFRLYANRDQIEERAYDLKVHAVAYFDGSVRGLKVGAPVEFRGIRVGRVVDIRLDYDKESGRFHIPVLLEIEPERLADREHLPADRNLILKQMVAQGLRAQLISGNLLTGQLLVDLDMRPETAVRLSGLQSRYLEMPTLPSEFAEITESVRTLLNQFKQLPIAEIGQEALQTAKGVNKLVNDPNLQGIAKSLNDTLASWSAVAKAFEGKADPVSQEILAASKEVTGTLKQVTATLATVEDLVAPDSALQFQLVETLKQLSEAARAARSLATTLDRNPQSLLFGNQERR